MLIRTDFVRCIRAFRSSTAQNVLMRISPRAIPRYPLHHITRAPRTTAGISRLAFLGVLMTDTTPVSPEHFDRSHTEEERRENGRFYTPRHLVRLAHDRIAGQFGDDWKEKFVVWDCCCGTGNLTRGFIFKELYSSTNEPGEIAHIPKEHGTRAFVFDFLNDELISDGAIPAVGQAVPASLRQALEQDKAIMFFINPPYAKGAHYGTGALSATPVNARMRAQKLGQCAANLYAQFLYRILELIRYYKLTRCVLALFCPTLLLCGGSFVGFRKIFLREFAYQSAVIFSAKHFSDTASHWAVAFSLWDTGTGPAKTEFMADVVDWDRAERECLAVCGNKLLYNVDDEKPANIWVREHVRSLQTQDAPNLTSGIKIKTSGIRRGKTVRGALGYLYSNSNNIEKNPINVGLFSAPFSAGEGVAIIPQNFDRCITLFAARKLIKNTWINNKDEYLAPNEAHGGWGTFVDDCLVFCLFHSASNQSSMRDIIYKERPWDIYNHFFFLPMAEIGRLAQLHACQELLSDMEKHGSERYVYQRIARAKLSPEAQTVYDGACTVVRITFAFRKQMNMERPELHLGAWDAGWYQVKKLAESCCPDVLTEFNAHFVELSLKMVPQVYELGFLRK